MKRVLVPYATTFLFLLLQSSSCQEKKSTDLPARLSEHKKIKKKFVHSRGSHLFDTHNQPIQLKGTNIGHWLVPEGYMFKMNKVNSPRKIDELLYEMIGPDSLQLFWQKHLDNYIQKEDIKYLKSIGCNHIRVPFHYKLFTKDLYLGERNSGFKYLDRIVKWCKEEELYVLLDMHCAPGGQTGDNIDDSYGYPYLLKSKSSQDLLTNIWAYIAKHYANESTVLGYDIVNEPIASYFESDVEDLNASLFSLYERVITTIRKVDENHLIFLNGSLWSTSFDVFSKKRFYDENIVYEFHKYWFEVNQSEVQTYLNFSKRFKVPIYVGETGENTDEWIMEFRTLLDKNEINWCFWPYKKMNNTKGIMNFKEPKEYKIISKYAASDRSSYAAIRENRPDPLQVQQALNNYLENCQYKNCFPNKGYSIGLGFYPLQKNGTLANSN